MFKNDLSGWSMSSTTSSSSGTPAPLPASSAPSASAVKCADQTAPVGCAIEPLVVNDGKPRPLLFVNDPMHVQFDALTSHIQCNLKARQGVFRRETCGAAMSDNNEARSQIQRVGIHVPTYVEPSSLRR